MCSGLSLALLAGRAGAGPTKETPRRAALRYVVRPGDTVWAIAVLVAGPAADPRPVVARLVRLNDIRDGLIVPGQTLRLAP